MKINLPLDQESKRNAFALRAMFPGCKKSVNFNGELGRQSAKTRDRLLARSLVPTLSNRYIVVPSLSLILAARNYSVTHTDMKRENIPMCISK